MVQKEVEAGLRHATTGKTPSVNPAVNRYLFRIGEGEEWAPPFISCAQDTVGLTTTAPTAMENLYL